MEENQKIQRAKCRQAEGEHALSRHRESGVESNSRPSCCEVTVQLLHHYATLNNCLYRGILSFSPQSVATDLKSHELIWLWTVKKPRKMIWGCVQAHVDLKAQTVVFITNGGIQINTDFSRHASFEKTKIDKMCFLTLDPGARCQFESVLQLGKHLFVVADRQCVGAWFLLLYFTHSNSLITNVKVLAATANSRTGMIDRKQHETENRLSLNTIRTQLNMWYLLGVWGWWGLHSLWTFPQQKYLFITALILPAGELVNALFGLLLDYGYS